MSHDPSLDHTLREFMRLWQEQWLEAAKDPSILSACLQPFQAMQSSFQNSAKGDANAKSSSTHSAASATAELLATVAARLAELTGRIGSLEERIANLEASADASAHQSTAGNPAQERTIKRARKKPEETAGA